MHYNNKCENLVLLAAFVIEAQYPIQQERQGLFYKDFRVWGDDLWRHAGVSPTSISCTLNLHIFF